jgi:hypothetical protein
MVIIKVRHPVSCHLIKKNEQKRLKDLSAKINCDINVGGKRLLVKQKFLSE